MVIRHEGQPMNEIDIFSDPLCALVHECISFTIMVVYVEIAVYMVRNAPPRLPPSIVCRAL
jgi:hypothetical protein